MFTYAIINTDNDIVGVYVTDTEAYEELRYYNDEYCVVNLETYFG